MSEMRFIPSVTCDHCTVTSVGPIRVHRDDCPHSAVRTALTAAQAEAERTNAVLRLERLARMDREDDLKIQLAAAEARGREMEAMKEDVRMAETYMGGRNGNIIRYAGDHRRTLSEMIVRLEAQVQREAREEMQSQVAAARAEGVAAERERCLGILEMRDKDAVVRFCARLIREGAET